MSFKDLRRVCHLNKNECLPLVSVLIPTKNRPHLFELALKSVLNQTYNNLEIIVSDESENNETEQVIQPYLNQYSHIIYVKNQESGINFNNLQYLFDLSKGEYINYLMDDDLFHTEKIEKMMHYYLKDEKQEIRIVTSHRQLINEYGENLTDWAVTRRLFTEDTILDGIFFGNLVIKNNFNCIGEPTTVLFKKQDLKEPFGVFGDRNYLCNVDLATWMNLLSEGKIVYISETLSYFRIHNEKHLNSTEKIIQGAADYGHAILISPTKGFLSNKDEYLSSIQSCISYLTSILNQYKHICLSHSNLMETKTYLLFLEQLHASIKCKDPNNKQLPKICFTILAHDHEEVLKVQLENVRKYNPHSYIVVYNGGPDIEFGKDLGVPVCPYSKPLRYGNLTRFLYDTMRWLEDLNIEYDYLINLDNDVLFIKDGFEEFIKECMQDYDCMGPHMQLQFSPNDYPNFAPGLFMWSEWEKWQPIFKTNYFGRYFNPGQVYNRHIIKKMLSYKDFEELENLWLNSDVFALEEMFWITFALIHGGKCREYPWNFDESLKFVRHMPEITKNEVNIAQQTSNYFWIHPIKGNNLIKMNGFINSNVEKKIETPLKTKHKIIEYAEDHAQNPINKVNGQKISFIYCVNDRQIFEKSLQYINLLKIPSEFEIEILAIEGAPSIAAGYNLGMRESDAKYKVYLHQDVYIINQNFIFDLIKIFKDHMKLGILGVVGSKFIPQSYIWWDGKSLYGKVFESHSGEMGLLSFNEVEKDFESVATVDGLLIATQYDLPWRDDVFVGWHYYDMSQSLEFIEAQYEVGIPRQNIPWVIHDCGIVNTSGFDQAREDFINTYKEFKNQNTGYFEE